MKTAVKRAEELGAIAPGKKVSSRWLGHNSIQTTLIYLELVPDPTGSLAMVP